MDTALTAFTLLSAAMVLVMTPGIALFYGGLSRKKNVGNTIAMVLLSLGVAGVVWVAFGYSIAFDGSDGDQGGLARQFVGGLSQLMLSGTDMLAQGSIEDGLPDMAFSVFQGAFCMITVGIIVGSVSGRIKFGAFAAFIAAWVALVYGPLAHMVWDGGLIGETIGALDFAGGDVVHISSGTAGLVLALLAGKRRGYGNASYRAHSTPLVAIGAAFLWFGWMGFNGGSAFSLDDGVAALAISNTVAASCAGLLSWMVCDKVVTGHVTLVGACTGLVAGLVAITPAAGFVTAGPAMLMGAAVCPVCYFAIAKLKLRLGYDDALDAFGLHGVGGVFGGVMTGLFCVPELSWTGEGGLLYTGDPSLLLAQCLGILVTVAFVIVATLAIGLAVRACFGGSLRVDGHDEGRGLDVTVHGEDAYPAFDGMD